MTPLSCSDKALTCSNKHILGNNNTIVGDYNVIIGRNNKATGINNVVRGHGATASGDGSVAADGPGGQTARVVTMVSANGVPPSAERRIECATAFEIVIFVANPSAVVTPHDEASKYFADHLAVKYTIKDLRELKSWDEDNPSSVKTYHCTSEVQLRPATTCVSVEIRRRSDVSMKIMHGGAVPTVEHLGTRTRVNGYEIPGSGPYHMTHKGGYTVVDNLDAEDLDRVFGGQDVVTV